MRLSVRRRLERIGTSVALIVALVAYGAVIVQARRDWYDVRRTVGSAQLLGSDATRLSNAARDVDSGSVLLGIRLRATSSGAFVLPRIPALRSTRFANVLIAADPFVPFERTTPVVELVGRGLRTKIALDGRALREIALSPSRSSGYRLAIPVPRPCATTRCAIVLHMRRGRWRVWRVALTAEDAPNATSSVP